MYVFINTFFLTGTDENPMSRVYVSVCVCDVCVCGDQMLMSDVLLYHAGFYHLSQGLPPWVHRFIYCLHHPRTEISGALHCPQLLPWDRVLMFDSAPEASFCPHCLCDPFALQSVLRVYSFLVACQVLTEHTSELMGKWTYFLQFVIVLQ